MSDIDIQVEDVALIASDGDLQGHFKAEVVDGARLQIVGWAFSRYGHVASIEVIAGGTVIASTVPCLQRLDVREAFPAVDAAATSGFAISIEPQGSGRSALEVQGVLMDGTRHSLGWINAFVDLRQRRWGLR